MSFPFIASYIRLGTAKGPRRAVVWHFAEGGNTVAYLAKQNPNGVSVHYVIEYTGRVVQMLRLDEAHTSIRTTAIRLTDDADGFYGRTAAKAVLGEWADTRTTSGPNHASLAVEIEGFAASGPNAKQMAAMADLWSYLSGKYPGIRSLGHRDFADYKACPGRKIPWAAVGGHGPATDEEPMRPFPIGIDPKIVDIKVGAQLYNLDLTTTDAPKVSLGNDKRSEYTYRTGGVNYRVVEVTTDGVPHLWLVRVSDCLSIVEPPAPPPPDCAAEVEAAVAATKASARITWV